MGLILAAALALATGAPIVTAEPVRIGFSDLADPEARAFVDPYLEMGTERLQDLRTVVRLDARFSEVDIPPETRRRLEAERDAAAQALAADGYDIVALLAQRWTVALQRRQAWIGTNPSLEGAEVRLSGYLIPADVGADGVATGYLVPVVGMCSHIHAPPPNELVRLHSDPEMLTGSLYVPVSVTGTLRTEASDETIHLLDGFVRMQSLWRLDVRTLVAEVASPRTSVLRRAQYDPLMSASPASDEDSSK